jgi:O-antigen/teichoic acid export membrane protein
MFRDLSSLALGQFLSMLFGFLAFAYLARTLSTESYGIVEYSIGLAALAAVIIEGGLGTIGTLHISRDPVRATSLAAAIPGARLILALLVVPVVGVIGHVASPDTRTPLLVWLFAVSLLAVPFKQDWLLQGLEKMTLVAPAQAIKSATFALGVFVVVRTSHDFLRVGWLEVVAAFIGAGYYLRAQHAVAVPFRLNLRLSEAWPLIRIGSSIGATNVIWAFMLFMPIFLVPNVAGAVQAAWIGGVQRIVAALVSFSALYYFNLYPLMARALHHDRPRWERLMGSSVRVIAWTSVGCALAMTLMAEWLMVLVFGEPFRTASPVFAVYIWLLPLRLVSGHARWTLLAGERQGLLLAVELLGAGILSALGVLLVPVYGALGAAMAVVAANVIAWLAAHLVAARYVGPVPGIRHVLAPISSSLLAILAFKSASGNALVGGGLALLTYGACIRLMAGDLYGDAIRLVHAKQS